MQNENLISTLEENYYARFLNTDELLKVKGQIDVVGPDSITASGIPVGNINDKAILAIGSDHNLIIGSTGSGKTQTVSLPLLYTIKEVGESAIVRDIKGELYETTAEDFKQAGYEVIALDFSEPTLGNSWNPLTLPKHLHDNGEDDEALRQVSELSKMINFEKNAGDPFWQNTASSYLTGLALSLMEKGDEDEVNLNSISKLTMTNDDEEKDLLDTYFNSLDKNGTIYHNIASTHLAPPETKSSILSVLNQNLANYTNMKSLSSMLSRTDFDFIDMPHKKMIIYLISNTSSKEIDTLINIFIRQTYYLISKSDREGIFNYLLDSFDDNSVALPNLVDMLELGRGNKIRFTFMVKSYLKIKDLYGPLTLDQAKQAISNVLYLLTSDDATARSISEECGMKEVHQPLVSVDALKRMPMWAGILIKNRLMPYPTKLVPFYQMEIPFAKGHTKLEKRAEQEVKVFDLNKYFME